MAELIAALGCFGLLGIAWAVIGVRRLERDVKAWELVRHGAHTPIVELAAGTVVVRGHARRAEQDLAIGRERCLAWQEGQGASGCVPFLVEDESGSIRVEGDTLHLVGGRSTGGCRLLCDGDEVAVLGVAEPEPHASELGGNYREAPTRLVLRAQRLLVARRTGRVLWSLGVSTVGLFAVAMVSLLALAATGLCIWLLVSL